MNVKPLSATNNCLNAKNLEASLETLVQRFFLVFKKNQVTLTSPKKSPKNSLQFPGQNAQQI